MDSIDMKLVRNVCNKAALRSKNDEEYLVAVYDSLWNFSFTEDQVEYVVEQIADGIGNREAGIRAISKCKTRDAESEAEFLDILLKE